MPSSPAKEDDEAPNLSAPAAKRKPSLQNKTTPRRTTPVKPKATATPIRKASGNAVKTPNTAPARAKTGSTKKTEATLLGDFLLGRPTPGRQQRRKSLDAVKQELKAANVGSIKVPGRVQDRVKQWQKSNAAAVVAEQDPNKQNEDDEKEAIEKSKAIKGVDDGSVDEDERLRIKYRGAKRPGRQKVEEEIKDDVSEAQSRSTSAPRKRVISDEHWKKDRTPKKKSPRSASQKFPKDFLLKTATKEPLGHRVQEWIKISEAHSASESGNGEINRPLRHELKFPKDLPDDGIRIRPSPDISKSHGKDNGISINRGEKSPSPIIPDGGIRVKPIRKDGSKRRPPKGLKEEENIEDESMDTPTRRVEKHRRPSREFANTSKPSSQGEKNATREDDGDEVPPMTPTPSTKSHRKTRKSDTPSELSEIPFGNSAFSVLELPLGAEAGTMSTKRPPPKRTPSFGVPNVLKKVYNAVHDTSEPPRGGPNQPASIESWLNSTTDPFVDRPEAPQSTVTSSETTRSANTSYKQPEEAEMGSDGESSGKRMSHAEKSAERHEIETPSPKTTATERIRTRDNLPSMERSTPTSPAKLKRTPATRNSVSPKVGKKFTLKDSIFDAFRGESAMAGQNGPNPFVEITASRERVATRSPSYSNDIIVEVDEENDVSEKQPSSADKSTPPEPPRPWQRPLPPIFRGPPPVGGGHRLSTIASVETFSTSSTTETGSDVSQTTITQDTVLSATTVSSLSRKSNNKPNKPTIKRRLTKHSDLMSVLSLPDSSQPGRATSIRSARSVRTTRTKLDTATVQDVMREIAEDEVKYVRELKTLVDGVIPVLLTCVLSKSDSARAAGLFNPNYTSGSDPTFTKPIVDMGVALERLKSLHKRIPLHSADAFITWAGQAHQSYRDYVVAWRTGFQDVIVNLAPSSRTPSGEKSTLDSIPRNSVGDVIGANGERVDVAHLMKRPLVRTKYINKAIKGLVKLDPSCQSKVKASETWGDLETFVRRRAKEEEARRVDQAANCTDTTRARHPRTFAPAEHVQIDQTRQVVAQDLFSFDISHSNGQRMTCQVEILIRDKASDPNDCDVMICEVDSIRRFLLFPPLSKANVSARLGDSKNELVVMIRGVHDASEWSEEWSETFILEADDDGVASEWLDMLGMVPVPPPVERKPVDIDAVLSEISESIISMRDPQTPTVEGDIPVGERHRREAEETPIKPRPQSSHSRMSSTSSTPLQIRSEMSDHVTDRIVDLNDAMNKAGTTLPAKRARAARYHSKSKSVPSTETYLMSGGLDPYPKESEVPVIESEPTTPKAQPITTDLPYIPKLRTRSLPTSPDSTPLKESMRPETDHLKKSTTKEDTPPAPPPHRTLTPTGLKNTPVLESSTPVTKARRSSSPLKHEYQPSDASDTTSEERFYTDSESDSYSDSSDDDDELEAVNMANAAPAQNNYGRKRISPNGSMYSIPNSTLAPSNSASQGPYRGVPLQRPVAVTRKNMASISAWDNKLGKWVDLHKDSCSIIVTPGLIQAFEMSAAHSSPKRSQITDEDNVEQPTPLLAQVVTPMVPLRQSNALDIEIRVKPNAGTAVKKSPEFVTIRYRAATTTDASMLYLSLHRARLENPVWLKLEEERRVNCFGTGNFRTSQNQRSSWSFFKRRKSYRASARAPSIVPSDQTGKTGGSSFLQRLTGGGGEYNIAKSTVHSGAPESAYTSNPSDYSGTTPPRTPSSPSIINSSYSQAMLKNRGTEDLAIRLYQVHSGTRWEDMGPARLTVTLVPQGMRQASSLNHGIERRIIVTRKTSASFFDSLANNFNEKPKPSTDYYTFLDIVLGADCFQIIGRTGVCATVWEDVVGPNGEVGMVGATGGLAGRTRRWLFQTSCQADAAHIYNICAISGRGFRENY